MVSKGSKKWEPVQDGGVAVGEESSFIRDEYKRSAEHYFLPISRQWANPLTRFLMLKTEWEAETAHLSSITEIAMNPAYQQIIGMGTIAIPFILSELKKKPGHWFWALKSITGEDPVLPEYRGHIKQMAEAWLRWGKKQGYIKE
jgi:hypothetical protein